MLHDVWDRSSAGNIRDLERLACRGLGDLGGGDGEETANIGALGGKLAKFNTGILLVARSRNEKWKWVLPLACRVSLASSDAGSQGVNVRGSI